MGKKRVDEIDRHRFQAHAAQGGAFIGLIIGVILWLIARGLEAIFGLAVHPVVEFILVFGPPLILGLVFVYVQEREFGESLPRISSKKFRRKLQSGTRDFSKLDLRSLDLKGENLKGMVFRGSLLCGQDLEGLDLSGADLSGADLSYARLRYAKLTDTCLNKANLRGADMGCADLTHTDMREANLRRVNLKDAILRQSNLQHADFKGSQSLRGANFEQADLANADLFLGILQEAKFNDANLTNANLRGVNLIGADLAGAHLVNTDFRGVGSEHPAARLKDVNLEEAKMNQANLQGVIDVTIEQLLKASSLEGATMPDGTILKGLGNLTGPSLEEWIEKQI